MPSIKRNLVANYLGQIWAAIMGLAFVPLWIKYLGIEAYGLIGLFATLQAWLGLLDMGMTPTLSREIACFTGGTLSVTAIRDLLRTIEIIALCIACLMALGIGFSAHWLASSWLRAENLPIPVIAEAFTVMGVVTALRFVEGIYRSSIIGLQRQVLLNIVSSTMVTLRGLGAVGILIWVSPTLEAFFLWQGLISIITLILFATATYRTLPNGQRRGRFSLDSLRGVCRFAGGMMGITVLSLLLTQVDKVLLSKLLSLSEFGYYTLANVIASALYMLISPVTQAYYPRLSQLYAANDTTGLIQTYHQGAQLVSILMGSAAIVLALFSETFLQLWTRDIVLAHRTAPLLSLLTIGNLLNGLMWMPYQTQLAHGWTGLTVRINIVAVLFIVPGILWVTPIYGAKGAAAIWIILNSGYALIGVQFMYRRILKTEKWRWYKQDILQPLLTGTAMALLIHSLVPSPVGMVEQMAALILTSSLTLLSAGMATKLVRKQFYRIPTLLLHWMN